MTREPIHVERLGLILCEVYCHQTRSGPRFNASVTRLFRDGAVWKQSKVFGRDDLLLLAKVIDLAHTWICQHSQSDGRIQTASAPE